MKKGLHSILLFVAIVSLVGCGGGGSDGGGDGGDPTNKPTNAANDNANTDIDNAVTINVLQNDTVAIGGMLSVTGVSQGNSGSVTNNGDNTVTYRRMPDLAEWILSATPSVMALAVLALHR